MKIAVKVKPNSRQERVDVVGKNEFILHVKSPPKEGRANQAAIELLSEYFSVPKSNISLVRGLKSKNKVFEIL